MAYSMHKERAQRRLHSCAVAAISAALVMVVICTVPGHVVQARQLQLDPFAAQNEATQVAIHDEFSSGSQALPRSEKIQQHGSEEHVGISSLTIQESSGMEQAIVSMNWDLQSADVSHDRALLHDLGCLKARCAYHLCNQPPSHNIRRFLEYVDFTEARYLSLKTGFIPVFRC